MSRKITVGTLTNTFVVRGADREIEAVWVSAGVEGHREQSWRLDIGAERKLHGLGTDLPSEPQGVLIVVDEDDLVCAKRERALCDVKPDSAALAADDQHASAWILLQRRGH